MRWFDPAYQNLTVGDANTTLDGSETTLISQDGSLREANVLDLGPFVYVKSASYGVKGDGSTDDTTAFNSARSAARSLALPLLISGTPKITSQLTISSKEHWIFLGNAGNSSGSRPSSYLIKASTVLGDFITITASNTVIEYGGILGITGNTGDGYSIQANGVILIAPYVEGCGNDGIRIGKDSGVNSNDFLLIRPTSSINGRDGIHIFDLANANGGLVLGPLTQSNTRHGIYDNNPFNTYICPVSESNTGTGILLDTLSQATITGGDSEQNGTNLTQTNPYNNYISNLSVQGVPYNSDLKIAAAVGGVNILQNGGFSTDTIWAKGGSATISAGVANIPANSSISQSFNTVVGFSYTVLVTITAAVTRNIIRVGSTGVNSFDLVNQGYITTTGTFSNRFTAVSEVTTITLFNDVGSSGTSSWDNAFAVGNLTLTGTLGTPAPQTLTGDYTVDSTASIPADTSLIANKAGTLTLTLPSASTNTGRILMVRTIQNQTVVSASSNVIPRAGGSAGTAILAATAGNWALLQSDGSNWQIMAGS